MTKKEIAKEFLILTAKGDSRKAFQQYVGKNFKHHNVYFKADPESLMLAMEENAKNFPNMDFKILRALEDGDLVAVHSHAKMNPEDLGIALVHIFRFEENKIEELWDLGQPLPATTENEHGMF
jgi:predicted SnoaL-like aldol condensation-catalyzing enzyme